MYQYRDDTLAGIKLSSLFIKKDCSSIMLPQAVGALNDYMKATSNKLSPDNEAIKFYYTNHVFSLIAAQYDQHEILPPAVAKLAKDYAKMSADSIARLVYYTMMIIVRESRHLSSGKKSFWDSSKAKFTQKYNDFLLNVTHLDESGAVSLMRTDPPEITLREFAEGIAFMFHSDQAWSHKGGYGGHPWGQIADTLAKLVRGDITPEMFADTAYTLAHNNGPMFNKQMLYHNYSSQQQFLKILDVQRSGQIPQYVMETKLGHGGVGFKEFELNALQIFPKELSGYVDWFKVQSLGALGDYSNEQQVQLQKHGPSPAMAEEQKKDMNKFYVGVNPDDYVIKYEREVA